MARQRFQFGIGTILVVVALISIPLALYHGYVNDRSFGLKDGQTVHPEYSQGIVCGCWEESRYFIRGDDVFDDLE